MKHNVVRYSQIVLLIGLVAMAAGRANAQSRHENEIIIESLSWGISSGQTARISVVNSGLGDGSVRSFTTSIQLLDTEGEVIALSDEMEVAPGKIRFWDVPREQLPAGDSTGRIQVRARILLTSSSKIDILTGTGFIAATPATVELIDAVTGRTGVLNWAFLLRRPRPF